MHSDASAAPLISHPKTEFWVLIGFWALIGIGLWVSVAMAAINRPQTAFPGATAWQIFVVLAIFFYLPCALGAWLMRRLRIVADENGLHFRGLWKSRSVAWASIEDYELRLAPQATLPQSWICSDGQWHRLSRLYAHRARLHERIVQRARHSRARAWQLDALREDGPWPQIFVYRDTATWKLALPLVALSLLMFALPFFSPSSSNAAWRARAPAEWLDLLARPLVMVALFGLLALPGCLRLRAKRRLLSQEIVADREALTWFDGQNSTRILWADIADYYKADAPGFLALPRCIVQGGAARVVFGRDIERGQELCALIVARARHAACSGWHYHEDADSDTLGGAASLRAQNGRKIHHYRTRTARAMLLFGAVVLLILPVRILGLVPLSNGQMPTLADRMVGLIFVVPVVALTLGGVLAFWRASIQTDAEGVHQRGIWSARFLAWREIEAFTFNGHFYTLRGADTTIRFWLVAAFDSLRAEIEERSSATLQRTDRPNTQD